MCGLGVREVFCCLIKRLCVSRVGYMHLKGQLFVDKLLVKNIGREKRDGGLVM